MQWVSLRLKDGNLEKEGLALLGEPPWQPHYLTFLHYSSSHVAELPFKHRKRFVRQWEEAQYVEYNYKFYRTFRLIRQAKYTHDQIVSPIINFLP